MALQALGNQKRAAGWLSMSTTPTPMDVASTDIGTRWVVCVARISVLDVMYVDGMSDDRSSLVRAPRRFHTRIAQKADTPPPANMRMPTPKTQAPFFAAAGALAVPPD